MASFDPFRTLATELDRYISYQAVSTNLREEACELREWLRIITREPLSNLEDEQKIARATIEQTSTAGAFLTQILQGLNHEAFLQELLGRITKELQVELALHYRKDNDNMKELMKRIKGDLIADLGGRRSPLNYPVEFEFVDGVYDESFPVHIEVSGTWEYGPSPQRYWSLIMVS
jgi:hypothetical protein